MAGVGNDPEIGLGDVCCDQNGMGDGDGVMVAADDEGRAVDLVELVEGDMGLIEVEVEIFWAFLSSGVLWFFEQIVVIVRIRVDKTKGVRPVVSGQRLAPVKAIFLTLSGWRIAKRMASMPPSLQPMM